MKRLLLLMLIIASSLVGCKKPNNEKVEETPKTETPSLFLKVKVEDKSYSFSNEAEMQGVSYVSGYPVPSAYPLISILDQSKTPGVLLSIRLPEIRKGSFTLGEPHTMILGIY